MKIAVVNVKGGVGKTTTSVYLAAVAAAGGQRVVLVDADPQASAAEWLEDQHMEGVSVLEAPSERLIERAVDLGAGATVIVDTPPGSERLVRAALDRADVVVVPTQAGYVEVSRVQATLSMIPGGTRHGLVVTCARRHTRDYKETVAAWEAANVAVWGSIPERVAIAAGALAPLCPDGLDAYRAVLAVATGTEVKR